MSKKTRPTKKQFETLEFISGFIAEHGYSPSYREIMRGCDYTSVATVALHVKNLIARGHLLKRDNSARSLEVVGDAESAAAQPKNNNELTAAIDARLKAIDKEVDESVIDEIHVLIAALALLDHRDAARSYKERLGKIKASASAEK